MGLGKADSLRGKLAGWAVPIAMTALSLAFAVAGSGARRALQFDRSAIADGELWRLVSGHFAHLGGVHLTLNLAGLILVWLLVGAALTPRRWLAVLLVSIAAINAGFWWLVPELRWYVGLSGVLHGLLAAGVLAGWSSRPRESLLLGALLVGKLVYEIVAGALPATSGTLDGEVITEAHLYGAIGGAAAVAVMRLYTFAWRTTTTNAERE